MREHVPSPVATFTLAFEDPRIDETATRPTLDHFPGYALTNERAVCGADDLARLPRVLWHHEDPFISGVEISRQRLAELAARRVKVVLTGEGSDELFGGYPWFGLDRLLRPLAHLPPALRRPLLLGGLAPARWPRASAVLLAPPAMTMARYRPMVAPFYEPVDRLFTADLRRQIGATPELDDDLDRPAGFERWHPFTQLQYYEIKVRLPGFINHGLDRSSMAASLEARVPFLDHKLVELCAQVPPALKMRWLREKHILRLAMRDCLPRAIVAREKRGLSAPLISWLRGPLPDFARDLLSERCLRATGYFEPAAVADLLTRHRAGSANYAHQLVAVLTVQLWDAMLANDCRPPGSG
jgi:asparagine synthase (glutamine-hydrolysing)